jgi:hypothetical protein
MRTILTLAFLLTAALAAAQESVPPPKEATLSAITSDFRRLTVEVRDAPTTMTYRAVAVAVDGLTSRTSAVKPVDADGRAVLTITRLDRGPKPYNVQVLEVETGRLFPVPPVKVRPRPVEEAVDVLFRQAVNDHLADLPAARRDETMAWLRVVICDWMNRKLDETAAASTARKVDNTD